MLVKMNFPGARIEEQISFWSNRRRRVSLSRPSERVVVQEAFFSPITRSIFSRTWSAVMNVVST